tara:strand:+ start:79 stop:1146 length:1068 start_codon:yes stop_codon:yes gene_type:complete
MSYPELICTIGPSCDSELSLTQLKKAGVDIFRVNMSHATLNDLYQYQEIAKKLNIKLGLDTEGAQMRTNIYGKKEKYLQIRKGDIFKINKRSTKKDDTKGISLYPNYVCDKLEENLKIRFDFNGAIAIIKKNYKDHLECMCTNGGLIGNNKGVDILNHYIDLPDFTEKDKEALEIANSLGIEEIFISFCKSTKAINFVKKTVRNAKVTSKIESKMSIHKLDDICNFSDAILIDRGDLTREINIMDIPFAQRGIIKTAKKYNKPCYVATNILESLIKDNLPTRAELNDIVGTLEMGASGIVLAAETAIGHKPILCAEIVNELIHRYKLYQVGLLFADIERDEITDKEMRVWLNRND